MALRFYEKEVYCSNIDELDRRKGLNFFFSGHMDDIVLIYKQNGVFLGTLEYRNLILADTLEEAIQKEYVTDSEELWETARKCLLENDKLRFLPVLNGQGEVETFCYDDPSLNETVVRLWELSELEDAVMTEEIKGADIIYIFGRNEASYYLSCLLRKNGIPVEIGGGGQAFGSYLIVDGEKNAEPSGNKTYEELLLQDVSLQFELVDKIYRSNFEKLKQRYELDKKTILERNNTILYTQPGIAEKMYEYLLEKNIRCKAFCMQGTRMFEMYKNCGHFLELPLYILRKAVLNENSYDFIITGNGADRENEKKRAEIKYMLGRGASNRVWCLNDTEPYKRHGGGLQKYLAGKTILLVGDPWTSENTIQFLYQNNEIEENRIIYCNLYQEELDRFPYLKRHSLTIEECREKYMNNTYYITGIPSGDAMLERNENILEKLHQLGIWDISTYFSTEIDIWDHCLQEKTKKTTAYSIEKELKIEDIKGIFIGNSAYHSGNVFLKGLLDYHPNILMSQIGGDFEAKIWFYAKILEEQGDLQHISEDLKQLYNRDSLNKCSIFEDKEKEERFWGKLDSLISKRKDVIAADIFKAAFIACFYAFHRKYEPGRPYYIYIEPHDIRNKATVASIFQWAKENFKKAWLLKLVRDPIAVLGSQITGFLTENRNHYGYILGTFSSDWKKIESCLENQAIVYRFEDIKKYPKQTLEDFCNRTGLPWSDTLMQVTVNGRKKLYNNGKYLVSDFDLRPVYNQYEEYFNSFDRFRLDILFYEHRKIYGYSELDIGKFDKKQLHRWMAYPFKFEQMFECKGKRSFLDFRRRMKYIADTIVENLCEKEISDKEYYRYFKIKES